MNFLEASTYTNCPKQREVLTEMFKALWGDRPVLTNKEKIRRYKKLGLPYKHLCDNWNLNAIIY